MKRITLWFMSTLSALVLLFSYHTSTEAVAAKAPTSSAVTTQEGTGSSSDAGSSQTTTSGSGSAGSSGGNGTSSSTSSSTSAATDTSAVKTYTGDSVETRWGPVQVKITVSGGKITAAEAIEHPSGNPKDEEINSYAIPQLNSETLTAQSASIDMVSGATYTSDGYIQSLQSALDQANL